MHQEIELFNWLNPKCFVHQKHVSVMQSVGVFVIPKCKEVNKGDHIYITCAGVAALCQITITTEQTMSTIINI